MLIARRFRGPRSSGNGGYTAGLVASVLLQDVDDLASSRRGTRRAVEVTLRMPPPLDTTLHIERQGPGALSVHHVAGLVAEARLVDPEIELADRVDVAEATAAEPGYRGLVEHPFAECFVCGTDRVAGDGLRLRPGPLPGRPGTTACTWVPDASLLDPALVDSALDGSTTSTPPALFTWAALDCPGGWAVDVAGRPMVLGRMTARVDALPQVGQVYVVVGRVVEMAGRKATTLTALYDSDGRVLGAASAVWLTVDPSVVNA